MTILKIEYKVTATGRRPKHDPAKAKFKVCYVGPATDLEICQLQAWSIQQFLAHARLNVAAISPCESGGVTCA